MKSRLIENKRKQTSLYTTLYDFSPFCCTVEQSRGTNRECRPRLPSPRGSSNCNRSCCRSAIGRDQGFMYILYVLHIPHILYIYYTYYIYHIFYIYIVHIHYILHILHVQYIYYINYILKILCILHILHIVLNRNDIKTLKYLNNMIQFSSHFSFQRCLLTFLPGDRMYFCTT